MQARTIQTETHRYREAVHDRNELTRRHNHRETVMISSQLVFFSGSKPLQLGASATACSRAYWLGDRPTCRVKATLNVLAEP
jgi:hypothetical protein